MLGPLRQVFDSVVDDCRGDKLVCSTTVAMYVDAIAKAVKTWGPDA